MPKFLRILILFSLLNAAFAWPGLSAALARPLPAGIPEAEFRLLIQETQEALETLRGAPAQTVQAGLAPFRQRWQEIEEIITPSGERLSLDMFYLSDLLASPEPDLERIALELEHLQAERDLRRLSSTAGDLSALQAVLNRSEFQWKDTQPNPVLLWLDRLYKQFLAFLDRLLGSQAMEATVAVTRYLLLAAGVFLVIFALLFGVRTLLKSMVAEAEAGPDEHPDASLTAEAALDRAQVLSEAGDYRSAVRYLYLSTLLLLEERSLLRYDRSKTNREYLRSISHLPHLADILREVVEVFDRVWYGFQPLDEPEYTRYAQRVDELRRQK